MKRLLVLFPVLLVLCATSAAALVDVAIDPQSSATALGQTFAVQIQVASDGTALGVDGYINFDQTKLQVQSVTAGTTFNWVLLNRFDNTLGTVDCAAATLGGSPPTGTFALCTITFGTISTGTSTLHFSSTLPRKTDAGGSGGVSVLGTVTDGSVIISAAANTPTYTPTGPPAATPTPAPPPACCGDCNGNGHVSTAEQTTCGNIADGTQPWSDCPACDCNGNGVVTVDEILIVANHALNGCPSSATPIPGQPWAVNSLNSEAVALGRLNCRSGGTQVACLNTTILTADPASPRAGDFWCTDSGGTHKCCYATGASTKYCWTAN